MSNVKCPHCSKELTIVHILNPVVSSYLVFLKEANKFVLALEPMDFENFTCPHCGESLVESEIGVDWEKLLIRPWGDKKPLMIQRFDLPFDVKAIEEMEEFLGLAKERKSEQK